LNGTKIFNKKLLILSIVFVFLIVITATKDFLLTGNKPNYLFYVFIPPFSILGSTIAGFGVVKYRRISLSLMDVMYATLFTDIIGQIFENILKLTYYKIWQYPGWLFLLIILCLALLIPTYYFIKCHKIRWQFSSQIALSIFIGGVLFSIGIIEITGLQTPGS
jgi:hypothetical protein